jgi:lysophospholipase L1-like esterase
MLNGTWDTAKEKPDDPASVFTANLQNVYNEAQVHHVPVVLLALGSDKQTGNGDLHPYQQAMMDFAQANHVPMVNMIEAWRTRDRSPLFMDHVHPTQPGHELIANDLEPVVRAVPAYAAACQGNSSPEKSVAKP